MGARALLLEVSPKSFYTVTSILHCKGSNTMGRIKTQMIKRLTLQLVKQHKQLFSTDYVTNKKLVEQLLTNPSKKIRNTVAGYVTRLMQRKED
jgi:small subunit ribosomal protein S17e